MLMVDGLLLAVYTCFSSMMELSRFLVMVLSMNPMGFSGPGLLRRAPVSDQDVLRKLPASVSSQVREIAAQPCVESQRLQRFA